MMPSNDRPADLQFPIQGIDVTTEFQEQKPGTTPEAINVRGYDPIARRARGGSRSGISHYAPEPVPANTALDMTIQHLAVIVDPHATALPQNFVTPGDDWIEDPLNPGFFIPPGGWGNPGGAPEETTAAFVQANSVGHAFEAGVTESIRSVAFNSDLGGDRLIVVFFFVGDTNTPSVALSDSQGNTYTLREELRSDNQLVQCYTAPGDPGACTVTATVTTGVNDIAASRLVIMEYRGILLSGAGPFVDAVSNSTNYSNVSGAQQQTTTKVTPDSTGDIIVSFFDLPMGNSAVDVDTLKGSISFGPSPITFTNRQTGPRTGVLGTTSRCFAADSLASSTLTLVAGGVDATMDFDLGAGVVSFTAKAIALCLRRA